MLDPHVYSRIVVLTGAGVSVGSGLRTYRGADGVWNQGDNIRYSQASIVATDPAGLWRHFGAIRAAANAATPNAAHRALAEFARRLPAERRFTLITQNIDGLHQRAGSPDVIELHGSVHRTRCSNPGCALAPFEDRETYESRVPTCAACGAVLRPDIVLFGEYVPRDAMQRIQDALADCDLFVAIGTSGAVEPAASFVRAAALAGARTLLVNLEPMDFPNPAFQEQRLGPAEALVPALFAPPSGTATGR
jgi:NAD-dependent deacetylase